MSSETKHETKGKGRRPSGAGANDRRPRRNVAAIWSDWKTAQSDVLFFEEIYRRFPTQQASRHLIEAKKRCREAEAAYYATGALAKGER